jgi:4-hydroxy-3-methylbut-2-en-1-yl diphosphate synthase IspG/GcpE
MKSAIAIGMLLALCGCGVGETASVALTAAEIKAQEVKQAKQAQAKFEQNLNAANLQLQQRADSTANE